MTPLKIEILLHYFCGVGNYRNEPRAPAVKEAIDNFCTDGLLEAIHTLPGQPRPNVDYAITQRGIDMVTRICDFNKAVPMLLWCPTCNTRHIDEGAFATMDHHTHACQGCGMVWRPTIGATRGVQFLPGYKN